MTVKTRYTGPCFPENETHRFMEIQKSIFGPEELIFLDEKFCDRAIFGQNNFRLKNFSVENIFSPKQIRSIFFSVDVLFCRPKNIFDRAIFRPRIFSVENIFDRKFRCPYRRRRKQLRNSESSAFKSHDTPLQRVCGHGQVLSGLRALASSRYQCVLHPCFWPCTTVRR